MSLDELKPTENQEKPPIGMAIFVFGIIIASILALVLAEMDMEMHPTTIVIIIGFTLNFFLWFWLMKVLTDIRDSLKK